MGYESHNEAKTDNLRVNALVAAVTSGGSVLDIGCVQHDANAASSDEWVHDHLREVANELLGLDTLEEDVEELNDRGYNVVCADAQDFDLGREFDTIVAGEIIEHLSDFDGFLNSVRAHLKPDGKLIMTTPNPWAFHRFKKAFLYNDVPSNPEHTCWFDERTLRQLLNRHEFEVKNIAYVRPSQAGISRVLYDLGREAVGGTTLLVTATSGSSSGRS